MSNKTVVKVLLERVRLPILDPLTRQNREGIEVVELRLELDGPVGSGYNVVCEF